MNRPLLIAGLLATFTAALHTFGGTREIEGPLLRADMTAEVRLMLLACWHMVSAALFISALVLGLTARSASSELMAQVRLLSFQWLSFGAVFIGIDLIYGGPSMLLRLPQWALLLPIGVFGLWGTRANKCLR